MIKVTGDTKIKNGSAAFRPVSRSVDFGVTLVPGKNVAIRLPRNPRGGSAFTACRSRSHAVSCKNRKQLIMAKPSNPTVHQNSRVQDLPPEMKADKVGPAVLPKFKHQWNAVKALPLWCKKNRSTRTRGPRTPVIPPKKPEKNLETIKASN